MTSWHGNVFYITGPFWGEPPVTMDSPKKWPEMRSFFMFLWCYEWNIDVIFIWCGICKIFLNKMHLIFGAGNYACQIYFVTLYRSLFSKVITCNDFVQINENNNNSSGSSCSSSSSSSSSSKFIFQRCTIKDHKILQDHKYTSMKADEKLLAGASEEQLNLMHT